ncbi:LuxR C-terminal-related transcriptional regulator [Brevundimonas nasdae]|uniref:LuxR C-terminal-related transcriptional regulator n=1 Tax=Brevundimonas nasdae TaxID=172043 RepID=UPI003F68D2F2
MTPLAENKPGPANLLTDREREVMAYVAAHYRSKQIARLTGKAPKTIDAQVASACRKLGVASRDEAVRLLLDEGALQPIGENPYRESDAIGADMIVGFPPPVHVEGTNDDDRPRSATDLAGRPDAPDDLRRLPEGFGAGGVGTYAPEHDPVPGVRSATTGALSVRTDVDVRDPVLGVLPVRPAEETAPQLSPVGRPFLRLLTAVGIALGLAIIVPAALYGAVSLQRLVQSIQAQP